MPEWNDSEPIYRQLHDRVIARILDGSFVEGEPVPSVRQVASEERINPLTVSKAYRMLVDEGLLEMRRGLGMFVVAGAMEAARLDGRKRFLEREWPAVLAHAERLGISARDLLQQAPGERES